jgi:DNA/RNA-binding domain of Phe-tRNA-synthetase-like protein
MNIELAPHPLLRVAIVSTSFSAPLGELETPDAVRRLLGSEAKPPIEATDAVRGAVRDVLRWGGYKPTGRGKPASEYLRRMFADGSLSSINAAVDACNAVSLHTGLPISVIDLALAAEPFRIAVAEPGARYLFNAGGQEIDLAGLVCLHDSIGPCANAVRDSQRTKTTTQTTSTLSILWGGVGLEERLDVATRWYRELLSQSGAITTAGPL